MDEEITLLGALKKAIRTVEGLEKSNGVETISTASKIIASLVQEESSVETTESAETAFVETYYNKYKNGDKLYGSDNHPDNATLFIDDDSYYMIVANNQPDDITSVTIGGFEFKEINSTDFKIPENRYKSLSIGMNAFVYANVWKIQDGKLMVAIPWLYNGADASTGICEVMAGGISYSVTMFKPIEDSNKIVIKNVAVQKKDDHTAIAEVSGTKVSATYGHNAQAVMMLFSDGTNDIIDTTQPIFVVYDYMSMAITCPESVDGSVWSQVSYLRYNNSAATEPDELDKDYRIVIPGKGDINFSIHATIVVD